VRSGSRVEVSGVLPTSTVPTLGEIAEIVHDAELMDEKYARPESEGPDAIVRRAALAPRPDALVPHGRAL